MNKLKFFFIFSVFFYLISATYLTLTNLPKYDDIWTLQMVNSINDKGFPYEYYGEEFTEKIGINTTDYLMPALQHPILQPLIVTFFSDLFRKVFYFVDIPLYQTIRIFQILCTFLNLLLIYLLIKELELKNIKDTFMLSVSIYLLLPAVIQGSLLFSVDTSTYPLFINLFILFFLKYLKNKTRIFTLIFIFALILLNKYTTGVFLLPSIFIYFCLKKDYLKAIFVPAVIGILGTTICFLFMWQYAYFFDQNIYYLIKWTFLNRIAGGNNFMILLNHLLISLSYHFIYFIPPFICLLLLILSKESFSLIFNYSHLKKIELYQFLLIFVSITWFIYLIKDPDLYSIFPLLSLIAILFSIYLLPELNNINFNHILFFIVCSLYYLVITKDIRRLLPSILPWSYQSYFIILDILVYLIPFFIILAYNLLFLQNNKLKFKRLCLWFFILTIAIAIGFNLKLFFADYSIITMYGEKGFENTVEFMQKNNITNTMIISRWDIAYFTNNKFYLYDEFTKHNLFGGDNSVKYTCPYCAEDINKIQPANLPLIKNIKYIIYSDFVKELDGGFNDRFKEILNLNYEIIWKEGNYIIYHKIT